MKREKKKRIYLAACLLVAFVLWTAAVCLIDVREIGPNGSAVGMAALNGFVREHIGVHLYLYVITDWLSLVPLGFMMGFALLGLVQWIRRKKILLVDRSLLVLGCFYASVMAVYVLFEIVVVNYRPVLIEGYLEASYPSSTTMLVMCVMPTTILQLNSRIQNSVYRRWIAAALAAFAAFMVIGRLVSGVHWITDIVGGALVSGGLVTLYYSFSGPEQ